jgi:hypothetical protein
MIVEQVEKHAFVEFEDWGQDEMLMQTLRECIDVQWAAGKAQLDKFKLVEDCDHAVSTDALIDILNEDQQISDIRTNPELSNCIVFHTRNLDGSLIDDAVLRKRAEADEMIKNRVQALFGAETPVHIEVSGHFWYPKGGFMGWHTNLRKPGWRLYVNHATEEGKSFFRYRNPNNGEIVTAWDKHWNFRLFEISPERPFWHCVRSDTDRFSLGYKITPV